MLIMAVDPGGTTGVAVCEVGRGVSHYLVAKEHEAGRLRLEQLEGGWKFQCHMLLAMCEQLRPDAVVIESFQLRTKLAQLSPVQIGSVLDFELGKLHMPVEWQTPSERSVMTDARLRGWGLWTPGKPHQMDALRHLLVFARKRAAIGG